MSIINKLNILSNNINDIKDTLTNIYSFNIDTFRDIPEIVKNNDLYLNISSDVNFYDYNGIVLYKYTKDEFLSLTEMPPLPTRPGLICQGWNWDFGNAQEYVSDYGILDIGATYITDNGDTRLYINHNSTNVECDLCLYQSISNGVTINWGDGTVETFEGNGDINLKHFYENPGKYIIRLTPQNECELKINNVEKLGFLNIYLNKIEFGHNITEISESSFQYYVALETITIPKGITHIKSRAFSQCSNLKCVSLPNSLTNIDSFAFYKCSYLKNVSLPDSLVGIGGEGTFQYTGIERINVPNTTTHLSRGQNNGGHIFGDCYSLKEITVGKSVDTIGWACFDGSSSISYLKLPETIKNFNNYLFSGTCLNEFKLPDDVTDISIGDVPSGVQKIIFGDNSKLKYISNNSLNNISYIHLPGSLENIQWLSGLNIHYFDFSRHTFIPTLKSSSSIDSSIKDFKIRVPVNLYNEWINSTNWSAMRNHFEPVGENFDWFIVNLHGDYKKQFYQIGMTWEEWLNSEYNCFRIKYEHIINNVNLVDIIEGNQIYDIIYGAYIVNDNGDLIDYDDYVDGTPVTGTAYIKDGLSIILAPSGWYDDDPNWNNNQRMAFGGYGTTVTGLLDDIHSGLSNTNNIIEQLSGTTDSYSQYYTGAPAAEYCAAYSSGYKGVGEWYLPTAIELATVVVNNSNGQCPVSKVMSKIGRSLEGYYYVWSSTQIDASYAVSVRTNNSYTQQSYKYTNYSVLPVAKYVFKEKN